MDLFYTIAEGYETKEPVRGTEHSAGLDVFVPEFTDKFWEDFKKMNTRWEVIDHENVWVQPHDRILLPTGLRFNIPRGTYLEVANRGSVASKLGLVFGAHIIDEDYRGIVFINLINTDGNSSQYFTPGQKLVQLIHKEYTKSTPKKVSPEELYENMQASERGEGALGSTDKG